VQRGRLRIREDCVPHERQRLSLPRVAAKSGGEIPILEIAIGRARGSGVQFGSGADALDEDNDGDCNDTDADADDLDTKSPPRDKLFLRSVRQGSRNRLQSHLVQRDRPRRRRRMPSAAAERLGAPRGRRRGRQQRHDNYRGLGHGLLRAVPHKVSSQHRLAAREGLRLHFLRSGPGTKRERALRRRLREQDGRRRVPHGAFDLAARGAARPSAGLRLPSALGQRRFGLAGVQQDSEVQVRAPTEGVPRRGAPAPPGSLQ